MTNFLDGLMAQKTIPNPSAITLSFKGSPNKKGGFHLYDASDPHKEPIKTQLKEDSVNILLLGVGKKLFAAIAADAKRNIAARSVSSSFFFDYNTDNIGMYVNGSIKARGKYEEIKDIISDENASVLDIYFGIMEETGKLVQFSLKGYANKQHFKAVMRAKGGWKGNPYVKLKKGEKVEGDSFDYVPIDFAPLPMSNLTQEMINLANEYGPKVVEYLDYCKSKASSGAIDTTTSEQLADELANGDSDEGLDFDDGVEI